MFIVIYPITYTMTYPMASAVKSVAPLFTHSHIYIILLYNIYNIMLYFPFWLVKSQVVAGKKNLQPWAWPHGHVRCKPSANAGAKWTWTAMVWWTWRIFLPSSASERWTGRVVGSKMIKLQGLQCFNHRKT